MRLESTNCHFSKTPALWMQTQAIECAHLAIIEQDCCAADVQRQWAPATRAEGSTVTGNSIPAKLLEQPRANQHSYAPTAPWPGRVDVFSASHASQRIPGMRVGGPAVKASVKAGIVRPVSLASQRGAVHGQPDLTHPCVVVGLASSISPCSCNCRSSALTPVW